MAVDMFLKLDTVDGESIDSVHKGEIDILAFSWGASQGGTMHLATGGGAGKVNVQDVTITKYVDKATAKLWKAVCAGDHFATATLTVRKAGGTAPVEYLVFTFEQIIITSVSTGGSGGEERLTETASLNFAICKFEYKGQDGAGVGKNDGNFGWKIAENVVA